MLGPWLTHEIQLVYLSQELPTRLGRREADRWDVPAEGNKGESYIDPQIDRKVDPH